MKKVLLILSAIILLSSALSQLNQCPEGYISLKLDNFKQYGALTSSKGNLVSSNASTWSVYNELIEINSNQFMIIFNIQISSVIDKSQVVNGVSINITDNILTSFTDLEDLKSKIISNALILKSHFLIDGSSDNILSIVDCIKKQCTSSESTISKANLKFNYDPLQSTTFTIIAAYSNGSFIGMFNDNQKIVKQVNIDSFKESGIGISLTSYINGINNNLSIKSAYYCSKHQLEDKLKIDMYKSSCFPTNYTIGDESSSKKAVSQISCKLYDINGSKIDISQIDTLIHQKQLGFHFETNGIEQAVITNEFGYDIFGEDIVFTIIVDYKSFKGLSIKYDMKVNKIIAVIEIDLSKTVPIK